MKITYAPNPLNSKIELNETEKLLLKERIRSDEATQRLVGVRMVLDGDIPKRELKYDLDLEGLDKRVDEKNTPTCGR